MKRNLLFLFVLSATIILSGCGDKKSDIANAVKSEKPVSTSKSVAKKELTESDKNNLEAVKVLRDSMGDIIGINKHLSDAERNEMLDNVEEGIKDGSLDDEAVYYKLKSIVASVQCIHLYLTFPGTNPYKNSEGDLKAGFAWFGDKLVMSLCGKDYDKYLGCELISMNGITVKELEDRFAGFNPWETEASKKTLLEGCMFKCDLVAAGVLKHEDKSIKLKFKTNDGLEKEIDVPCCERIEGLEYSFLNEHVDKVILSDKVFYDGNKMPYTCYSDKENKVMYFRYSGCYDSGNVTFNAFFDKMIKQMKDSKIEYKAMVIDLRENKGGNRGLLYEKLTKYKSYLNKMKIVPVTGHNTYSAGAQAVEDCLQMFDNVVIYGEPTGQAISNYTEVKDIAVPSIEMTLTYPTMLDKLPKLQAKNKNIEDSAMPDVTVSQTLEDYMKGVDTVYQKIISDL